MGVEYVEGAIGNSGITRNVQGSHAKESQKIFYSNSIVIVNIFILKNNDPLLRA